MRWNFFNIQSLLFILTLLSFSLLFLNDSSKMWTTYVSSVMHIYFWSNAFVFLTLNYRKKTIKRFVIILLLTLLISIFATLFALIKYPEAARALYGNQTVYSDYSFLFSIGCGGFGFIYGVVFVTVALISNLFRKRCYRIFYVPFLFIYLLLTVYLILLAEFTIGIILLFLGIVLLIVLRKRVFVSFFNIAFILLFLFVFLKPTFVLVQNILDKNNLYIVSSKIDTILNLFETKSISASSRFVLYYSSIDAFLKSPIIGGNIAGNHSQILDSFAYLGLYGFFYFGFLLSTFFKYRDFVERKHLIIFSLSVLFAALLNPFVDMTFLSFVFLLTPLVYYFNS